MERKELKLLESLNQLALTEEQEEKVLAFFARQKTEQEALAAIDTEAVERMVHVMPVQVGMREDVASQPFTRDELQQSAPESMDGYWQVPRLVE